MRVGTVMAVEEEMHQQELLSLAGQLQHAVTVVRPGRTFVRRLFNLSRVMSHPDHHFRLSVAARSD